MKKMLYFVLIIVFLVVFIISFNKNSNAVEVTEGSSIEGLNYLRDYNNPIDYTESLETFDNPERGFYQYFYYNFEVENNAISKDKEQYLDNNLVHLRLGLGAFSSKVNGSEDLELSEDMLKTFDEILKKVKANGGTVIVRFAYDNFKGEENLEPALEMILKHVEQISKVITDNKDVISYVELGFFGPWGEMHSSDISTPENVTKALNIMLDNTPEEIKIGVRQPKYYVDFAKVDRDKLNENITVKGTKEYRVGLFNDGYLGSHSDLGTFEDRDIEIAWLEKQALHTLYGGEVVGTRGDQENDKINTANYMAQEAFKTHTSYLNFDYDEDVINSWKDEIYNGDDDLYKGQSGYLYITNHLGYRFVLRNSNVKQIDSNKININLDIENVGFANLVNSKKVSIILESDKRRIEFITDIDPTTWNSKEKNNLDITVSLPDYFEETKYNVYFRISKYGMFVNDNNYQCIRLANKDIWDATLGANYIGQFNYVKQTIGDTPSTEGPGIEDDKPGTEEPGIEDDKPSDEEPGVDDKPSDEEQDENDKTDVEKPENNNNTNKKPSDNNHNNEDVVDEEKRPVKPEEEAPNTGIV